MSESINMGIGDLGKPETVFSRKFRWTLGSANLPPEFMKHAKFDYVNKTIELSYYDIICAEQGMHALVWADNIPRNEELVFTSYDGCGNPLYTLAFSGLTLLSHEADFDYESSEPAVTVLTVRYDTIQKTLIACPDVFKRYTWKLAFEGQEYDFTWLSDEQRPNLNIEETEINHLNAKMWLPGKAKWNSLEIRAPWVLHSKFKDRFDFSMNLYVNDKIAEVWNILDAWVSGASMSPGGCEMKINFASVQYSNNIA